MPTTINGIGTHYYGKRNRETRHGVCQACGAQTELESYDTRLWFVFIMIPVIPLGRRRIIDQCPRCMRHLAAKLQQWEMSRQLSVSGATHEYREKASPEAALEVHGNFLGFRMEEQANEFREEALRDYPESAVLHAGLAMQLQEMGKFDESARLFEKALQLRPDLPEVRVGVAFIRMTAGELDQARESLSFLEEPGAGQTYPLGPLETLAHGYQQAGRHDETIAICKHLIEELPEVGQVHGFRKFVRTSEKASGSWQTILPKQGFSLGGLLSARSGRYSAGQRWLATGVVVAILVVVGMALVNEHRRRHRTVFALNDCGKPLQVSIDGGEPVEVTSRTKLDLAEGSHHVQVIGVIEEELDITMRTGYFERWTKSPVWVLNLGGASALADQTIYYAVTPPPPDVRVLIGERFSYFPDMDFAFEDPPDELSVGSENNRVTRTYLESPVPANHVVHYALEKADVDTALGFAESRLSGDPTDAELLATYVEVAKQHDGDERAEEFLAGGLWKLPLSIPWHRTYGWLNESGEREESLAAEYDVHLEDSPDDAVLLYLRGRVTSDSSESERYFRRATEADAELPWPWMALAFEAGSRGEWEQCRTLAQKARELGLDDPSLRMLWHMAALATGETSDLEAAYLQKAQSEDFQVSSAAIPNLCDLLIARGKPEEARQALTEWQERLAAETQSADWLKWYGQIISYMSGDLEALDDQELLVEGVIPPGWRLQFFIALGRPEDAVEDAGLVKAIEDPWNALALSVAFAMQKDDVEAAAWRERACTELNERTGNMRRIVAILRGSSVPTQEQLDAVTIWPHTKAIVLASLMAQFPDEKVWLAEQARLLNVSRQPPYLLVQKAIEWER